MDAYCDRPYKTRVFISAPLSYGDSADERTREDNIEYAMAYAELLESRGFKVFCPHRDLRRIAPTGATYKELMQRCFKELRRCQAVLFLKNWKLSKGCVWEAKYLSMMNKVLPIPIEAYEDVQRLLATVS